jgi:hydrogenase expression/formation protein HypC
MVPEAAVGDYVIIHVGFAISRVDEEAARRSLELYRTMARRDARLEAKEPGS